MAKRAEIAIDIEEVYRPIKGTDGKSIPTGDSLGQVISTKVGKRTTVEGVLYEQNGGRRTVYGPERVRGWFNDPAPVSIARIAWKEVRAYNTVQREALKSKKRRG